MSSLNDQLNSFRAKVRSAPVLGKRVVDAPKRAAPEPAPAVAPAKRPRPVVYQHSGTALVHAIDYLKKHEVPILLRDLESYLSASVEPLIPALQQHANIRVNLKDRTATYVSRYDIYSGDDLVKFLRGQPAFAGVPVKDLKDGWSGALPTITRLEQEQKILVTRNKKDNTPVRVWANGGGPLGSIDKMFVDMWQAAKVPSANELPGTLENVGLKPSSVDPSQIKHSKTAAPERKQKRSHRGKITNTHLRGVLKDYQV